MSLSSRKWKFAVDRGGTFTDVVAVDPDGKYHALKLLSNSPRYGDASIEGVRKLLGLQQGSPLPQSSIEALRIGTTLATNALLERKGGRVGLLVTKGFSDLLAIGYQNRPDIFALCIKRPSPLYTLVTEVDERMDSKGAVIRGIDENNLRREIQKFHTHEIDTVAVVFMHSWRNPGHEIRCRDILREQGFSNIYLSHETMNQVKIVSRGQSTMVDAYLRPVLAKYLEEIRDDTGNIPVEFMQSNGTLSPGEAFTGKNALLSGPAGGVIAIAHIAEENRLRSAIGFDMGGTSTDISRIESGYERIFEKDIAGITLQNEMIHINTVAAGGGSVLSFDGQKMLVGPESAGAWPGPACYGFGGPLTVTDANLLTGRLIPEYFPKTFGRDIQSSLDTAETRQKFNLLTEMINNTLGSSFSIQEVANGFLRVANEKMAIAIREISVSRGIDVRNDTLICFGGAAGQHACDIASLLDMEQIVIHPFSGVLSAFGIGLARSAWKTSQTVLMPYDESSRQMFDSIFGNMENKIIQDNKLQHAHYSVKREIDLRPQGTEPFLTMEYDEYAKVMEVFRRKYTSLYGFIHSDSVIEAVNVRIELRENTKYFDSYKEEREKYALHRGPTTYQEIFFHSGPPASVPVYLWQNLTPSQPLYGPLCIIDDKTAIIVNPDFEAMMDENGILTLKRMPDQGKEQGSFHGDKPDPVLLEVFNNLFMGVAREMGITLQQTAHSVNMKERLDFSCAVFDGEGNLVANAPHIPVHLGAMSDTVKSVVQDTRDILKPGDIYLSNNPYRGGSHLPDITVVCPVFSADQRVIFFTASRGHHADIGGITPGSMPPQASHIDEEGILMDNLLIVRQGVFRENELRHVLSNHRYPARNIEERICDINAQIASCHKGWLELQRIMDRYGLDTVMKYMLFIQDNAERSVREALFGILKGRSSFLSTFEDSLDDGSPVQVKILINEGNSPPHTVGSCIDFTGTGIQHEQDNLNAPLSVTRSAVLYVLRSLINKDIPLNSGCLKPVNIIIPKATILNPEYPAPVATGNVETSQRIVDVLLGAFGIAAASQGTMNNVLFEVEGETPYYETIGGGSGAMESCEGASGVQVHMTNTRMTDPEILEIRHPGVRIEKFVLRKGSGGEGIFRGGDGIIREIAFLKPATVSILSERRKYPPYGMKGGRPGKCGENILRKPDGSVVSLKNREVLNVKGGESIIIKTPGGGGYGGRS
jgi:5-oxoprolinase (ATP-hydrolysing)